jgi:hypothetical protein
MRKLLENGATLPDLDFQRTRNAIMLAIYIPAALPLGFLYFKQFAGFVPKSKNRCS